MKTLCTTLACLSWLAAAQSTINSVNRHSYGANVGWMDWRVGEQHGVVIGQDVCSGYIYAANLGWIHIGDGTPADGISYRNDSINDFGVNHEGRGHLRGFAWSPNVGWLNFESVGNPRVDLMTGRLSGYVYGANIGWISLSNALAHVQTDSLAPSVDEDNDGIPDSWERRYAGSLTPLGGTGDRDGDGVSDGDEYRADTNPLDPMAHLRIVQIKVVPNDAAVYLTWASQPTRIYQILQSPSVAPGAPWADAGIGWVLGDLGDHTIRGVPLAPTDESFYQVAARLPLTP